jgi:putative PIN family toxin of toxin-antitoxin system
VIRAVLDTNVVIAAMLNPTGRPADVVGKVRVDFDLVWSPPIVAECHRVVDYRKFRSRFRVEHPHDFVDDLADAAIMVVTELPRVEAVPADPSDDVYIATALVGAAPWVVTGDERHLLPLGTFAGVRMVTPSAFLAQLAAPDPP